MTPDEFDDLLEKVLNGELDRADHKRLQAELKKNEEARTKFVQATMVDSMLEAELAPIRRVMQVSKLLDDQQAQQFAHNDRVKARQRRRTMFIGLAAAASIALFAILTIRAERPSALATVTVTSPGAIVEHQGRQIPLSVGMTIEANDRVLVPGQTDAEVALAYEDGTTVRIDRDSSVLLREYRGRQEKDLKLEVGSAYFDVAPQPLNQPLTVHTRGAVAKVIGTKLTLETNSALTRLKVLEGTVDFGGSKSASLHRVRDGGSAVVHHDDGSLSFPDQRMAAFKRWKLKKRVSRVRKQPPLSA